MQSAASATTGGDGRKSRAASVGVAMGKKRSQKLIVPSGPAETRHEVDLLYRELSVFGIMQFVRSARIAVTKDEMKISELLQPFTN